MFGGVLSTPLDFNTQLLEVLENFVKYNKDGEVEILCDVSITSLVQTNMLWKYVLVKFWYFHHMKEENTQAFSKSGFRKEFFVF